MTTDQIIPVYLINLDRRTDRLDYMSRQLDAMGVTWTRVSAVDAETVTDDIIDAEVDRDRLMFAMSRGSQACAITNFNIWRQLAESDHPAALILQDDVDLSPDIVNFLHSTDWLPRGFELIQLEKYGSPKSRKLIGKSIETSRVGTRTLHALYSRTAGAGAYVITREGARRALEVKKKARYPIDQILFNMNISNVSRELGLAIVNPFLAIQRKREFVSDIQLDRPPMSRRQKIIRGWFEINLIPRQLVLLLTRKATVKSTRFVK